MASNREALAGKRLDSWKEIAAFLGRAERTVKRWETERGLPVHRLPGGGRSAVFAYSDELADWLKGRSNEGDLDDEESASGPVSVSLSEEAEAGKANLTSPNSAPRVSVPTVTNWPPSRLAAWLIPLILAAALVAAFISGHRDARGKPLASPQTANAQGKIEASSDSIAVLPFSNAHEDAKTDFLSDGITESLIGNLARVPQLKVRSRDSVFRYKGKDDLDPPTVGNKLGVSIVVSGRVILQGDAIEISTELTDVRDNTEIWGQNYTGKRTDLIGLQQQIAGDIAEKLRSQLSASERQQVTRLGTQNPDAYELYLKGRYAWNKRTLPDLESALSYLNQAVAKDPNYALAYSALADVYSVMPIFRSAPTENFPKSNAAARKALELDPTLAHPHAVLGVNETQYDWDFPGGEAEFKKAMALDPYDATAHQWYAESLDRIGGRQQEALAEINRAHQLDPLSPVIARVLGGILVTAKQYDQGIAVCEKLANDNPTFAIAHDCLAQAYWAKGSFAQSIAEWKTYGQLTGNPEESAYADAMEKGFRSGGREGALTKAIEVREPQVKTGHCAPVEIAILYAGLGDKQHAFEWLDTAYHQHDWMLIGLNTYYQFDPLRSDPRFAELVRKVGLP